MALLTRALGAVAMVAAAQSPLPAPTPVEPVSAFIEALRTYDVVGSDLGHSGAPSEFALLVELIRDRRFPATKTDLVWEGLGARYQSAMDRYLQGENVPDSELKPIWNDTTQQQIPGPVWTGEIPSPLNAVREINQQLAADDRIHVWLGDPPIEWENVHSAADFRKWLEQRDTFPAAIVRDKILAKRRHALVLFGGGHLQRRQQATNYQMDHPLAQTVISLLERGGARALVISNRAKNASMATWPVPSFALIRGTNFGAEFVPQGSIPRVTVREDGSFAPIPRDQWIEIKQEEQFDAVLYLGDANAEPAVIPKTICSDPKAIETRLQRIALTDLPAFIADRLRSLCSAP